MLRGVNVLEEAYSNLSKALIVFSVNALIPPILLLIAARLGFVYRILWALIVYEALCLGSLLVLYTAREALTDYSLSTASRLMRIVGILGLFTGLVIGGVLVLKAGNRLKRGFATSRVRFKKSSERG